MLWKNHLVKMPIPAPHTLIYTFNSNTTKIPARLFWGRGEGQRNNKLIWKCKEPRRAKAILKRTKARESQIK